MPPARCPSPPPRVFRPALWLPGSHLQTIVPALWPAPAVPGAAARRIVEVDRGSSVLLELNWPQEAPRGTLLLLHGMGGSADSTHLRRTAGFALGRGWIVARVNLRTCGGSEHLSQTLYNAGQSDDVGAVLAWAEGEGLPRPFAVVGFSLGGNLVLRYAGMRGEHSGADAFAAVNPPIDLETCSRAIERPSNRLYQRYYTRGLCRQLERVRRLRPVAGPPADPRRIRTVRRFDEWFTAPDAGYPSAEAYYAAASAGPYLTGLRRPALILSARNDPFVPPAIFASARAHPWVELLQPRQGGHCGYWQSGRPRFWAAVAVLDFLERRLLEP